MLPAISLSTTITVKTNITVTLNPPSRKLSTPLNFNSTLRFLSKSGNLDEALSLIESSPSKSTAYEPDDVDALSSLLHACISRRSFSHGQKLYFHFLQSPDRFKQDFLRNPILKSKLITLFSVCGRIDEARQIFNYGFEDEKMPESVWVAMAIGYSRNGFSNEALMLYFEMLSTQYARPNNFALSMALKACADTSDSLLGRAVHAQVIKSDEEVDQVVNNALLRFYVECGFLGDALKVFEGMPQRNVVSWNTLVAGVAAQDKVSETFDAFRVMQGEGIRFSWVTLTTILSMCARVTALHSGKEMHAQILKSRKKGDLPLLNSLVDMYAKCGALDYCKKVFNRMQSRDLTTWNTMLTGYAINGYIEEAMALFDEMISYGMWPDGITFIALLSGCSYSGLADKGQELFNKMEDYGVKPSSEHYACLVDVLGRAGRIEEALALLQNMPMNPSGSIWGSLLNSCRLHSNVPLAEVVAGKLFEIEPHNPGNYVMLSNIYAKAEMWHGVKRVREMMAVRGIKKEAGCSWTHIKHRIHTFIAGGSSEFRSSAEYSETWSELSEAIKEAGYIPDTDDVLHDVNEEMKVTWACGHSERIAAIFALIHTADGMPIRITKNLRVCGDCHSWMKAVSRVTARMIVLRDTNRFHHFANGSCSCKDFW
ncbi:pentatricopeptide repeat-containing protein At3g14330-like isoform X1 [Prosopis cineraria]|uniref:pentatricopeptide repeat-containing protein At3g14330-like isoform X1 n=1 Tax=Prosopis cineraria TaxID=364024 RepID=UPI0024108842|nr:pentatricopeptide repeat-containing protein At3g14330-like isoform X1 [Prosopis cineraria]